MAEKLMWCEFKNICHVERCNKRLPHYRSHFGDRHNNWVCAGRTVHTEEEILYVGAKMIPITDEGVKDIVAAKKKHLVDKIPKVITTSILYNGKRERGVYRQFDPELFFADEEDENVDEFVELVDDFI